MYFFKILKKTFFPFYKKKVIKDLFNILNDNKRVTNAMFVGGCVRKFLSNEEIDDIDIATILTPEEIIKKFERKDNFEIKNTGISHGTVTLVSGGESFEITTLREDVSTDGRHAQVSFTKDWIKDSRRRDFTVNAIYMSANGKIFDPQNGIQDLKNKNIKFIGDPEHRIKEDYLRIFRYLRFSLQYKSLEIENETAKAINTNLNGIKNLSKERIFLEINKIISLDNLDDIFKSIFLLNLIKVLFPEFRYLDRIKNLKSFKSLLGYYPYGHILSLLLVDKTDNHAYFSHKYKVSNSLKGIIEFYFKNFIEIEKNNNFFKKDLEKNIFYMGKYLSTPEKENYYKKNNHYYHTQKMKELSVFYFMTLKRLKLKELKNLISRIDSTKLAEYPISGEKLLKNGLKSGKRVGQAINEIEKTWLQNNFELKEDQLKKLIKKFI